MDTWVIVLFLIIPAGANGPRQEAEFGRSETGSEIDCKTAANVFMHGNTERLRNTGAIVRADCYRENQQPEAAKGRMQGDRR